MNTTQGYSDDLVSHLDGKRLMPDVSVLLTGLLVEDSDSAALLAHARLATVVISRHIEQTAIRVLRRHAPQHLGSFGEALVRLAQDTNITRVAGGDPRGLPAWARRLHREDQQVLADAIGGRADILFVQDSEFFQGTVPGLVVQTPSTLIWPLRALEPDNVQAAPETWTFLGWFVPQWGSSVVSSSGDQFFIFEIKNHVACWYDGRDSTYKLRWNTTSGSAETLVIRQMVERGRPSFVAVAVSSGEVFFFVNGETRGRRIALGPTPTNATFHPFMSAASEHQVCGAVQFRVVPSALSEKLIRKHWRARTVRFDRPQIRVARYDGCACSGPAALMQLLRCVRVRRRALAH